MYEQLLEVFADPAHEVLDDMVNRVTGPFDLEDRAVKLLPEVRQQTR